MLKSFGLILSFFLFSCKLWAPTYSYTIRDSEFDYYYGDSFHITLKNLRRKDEKLDICVEAVFPNAPYVSLKMSETHRPVAKKLKRIMSPVKHKVFLGSENPKSETNFHKLELTKNFTTHEKVIPIDECLGALSIVTDGDVCLAQFDVSEGECALLLTRVCFDETLKLEVPVEIVK